MMIDDSTDQLDTVNQPPVPDKQHKDAETTEKW
jgi:hypothetical protein